MFGRWSGGLFQGGLLGFAFCATLYTALLFRAAHSLSVVAPVNSKL